MNLWTITVGEPLPGFSGTARIWRGGAISSLMATRGHNVTWWTSSVNHFNKSYWTMSSKRHEARPGLTLQFLHGCLYRRNISVARYRNHQQIAAKFTDISRSLPKPDLILCSFPPIELSAAAVQYGLRSNVPVVLDIRDLWPDEILTRVSPLLRPLVRLSLAPMYRTTSRALLGATGIVAISATYLNWALDKAGRRRTDADKVFPLGYTGALDTCHDTHTAERQLKLMGVDPNKKIFWFSGTFVGNIDLGTVIEAARILQKRVDIQFVFSGSGEREEKWRAQARGLDNVIFTGWLDMEGLAWLSKVAWAGLGSYRPAATMSLPNKLFEYMSMGLPVLSSLGGEARELVESSCLGDIYPPGEPSALADLIACRAQDVQWRNDCSARAKQLFSARYSSEITYGLYADYLEQIAVNLR